MEAGLGRRHAGIPRSFAAMPRPRSKPPKLNLAHAPPAPSRRHRDGEPALEHREKKQVQLDVVRSMTHFAMRREEREARLKQVCCSCRREHIL